MNVTKIGMEINAQLRWGNTLCLKPVMDYMNFWRIEKKCHDKLSTFPIIIVEKRKMPSAA